MFPPVQALTLAAQTAAAAQPPKPSFWSRFGTVAKEAVSAIEAAREFELAKSRASSSGQQVVPGASTQYAGGTGLSPGIPTWALLGVGGALLLVLVLSRK